MQAQGDCVLYITFHVCMPDSVVGTPILLQYFFGFAGVKVLRLEKNSSCHPLTSRVIELICEVASMVNNQRNQTSGLMRGILGGTRKRTKKGVCSSAVRPRGGGTARSVWGLQNNAN